MRALKAPAPIVLGAAERSVFLAGPIDGGAAENWQLQVERALSATDWVVLKPRRDDWRAVDLPAQIDWELEGLERHPRGDVLRGGLEGPGDVARARPHRP